MFGVLIWDEKLSHQFPSCSTVIYEGSLFFKVVGCFLVNASISDSTTLCVWTQGSCVQWLKQLNLEGLFSACVRKGMPWSWKRLAKSSRRRKKWKKVKYSFKGSFFNAGLFPFLFVYITPYSETTEVHNEDYFLNAGFQASCLSLSPKKPSPHIFC